MSSDFEYWPLPPAPEAKFQALAYELMSMVADYLSSVELYDTPLICRTWMAFNEKSVIKHLTLKLARLSVLATKDKGRPFDAPGTHQSSSLVQ